VESNLPLDAAIADPEEKPLGAAGGVYIFLKKEIVFPLKWRFYSVG
jgi:hypothetical protein